MTRNKSSARRADKRDTHQTTHRQELILAHREAAHRLGKSLLRRSGIYLDPDEAASLFDLALCEAARSFNASHGASLLTWFFYNLRTALRCHISGQIQPTNLGGGAISASAPEEYDEAARGSVQLASADPSPEEATYQGELRAALRSILAPLDELHRSVVLQCHLEEESVAQMARKLGYSRSHLSLIKSVTSRRIRSQVLKELKSEELPLKQAA